ncbi:MAG TPA: hypothetical protein VFN67_37370 [Polyangiales bacterium]|nr:hypothetical protein [Polyangiales bacterium]
MTERPDVLQRAITELRSLDGTPDEVSALAARMSLQLSTPASPQQPVAAATRSLARVWFATGIALVGAGAFYAITQLPQQHVRPAPALMHPTPVLVQPAPELEPEPQPQPMPAPAPAKLTPKRVQRKPARTSGASAPPPAVSAELELSLIGQAQAALDRAPTQALELTAQHARDYPRGLFVEEREVIAIEAELKLRHSSAASERARRFLAEFPRSTHARKVRTLVEE